MFRSASSRVAWWLVLLITAARASHAQVFFSEILYHPVEEPAFDAQGSPVLDLSEDVHEFVELHNPGNTTIALDGWKLTGGIDFTFPNGIAIQPAEYLVVARNPARLAAVAAYQPAPARILGPYTGQLSNRGETLRLRDAQDHLVDAVSYSAQFPWAIGADGMGADEEWTGLRHRDFQYHGRSLERVSVNHPANDPANWLASPAPGTPSPGRANAAQRATPLPIVVQLTVSQEADEQRLIRQNQPVRVQTGFSARTNLGAVELEYFVDDINRTDESITNLVMTAIGDPAGARFTAAVPGLPNRSIVRYRVVATRAGIREPVSPRADDPFRWHAYFVTPTRTSPKPIYDCFISSASLTRLNANISGSPKRIVAPDPPGTPRASWNATEPAVFVYDGEVRDIRMRYHGSRYNRNAGRNSYKWFFPRYHTYLDTDAIFETDKGNDFVVGHGLFINAGLPVSSVRYVDLYLNNNGVLQRLEQGEFNGDLLTAYHRAQQQQSPGSKLEPNGELYKSVGTIETSGEGPYGRGDERPLVKPGHWTALQMYEWTYSQQNNSWRGHTDFKRMIDAMWVARGDTPNAPKATNIPALRTFFTNYFDIDTMLTSLALQTWICPWDDTTQNHFLWRRANDKWCTLPWDCDAWFGRGDNTPATSSIYIGEVGDRNNNFRGPNFIKDSFFKAFRQEYKERLYLLNNTYLHPDNITAMGFGSIRSFADARFAAVNQQCGLGAFQRPGRPINLSPANAASAVPNARLQTSAYSHSAVPALPHAQSTWEIRRDDGSYLAPVYKLTTASNLTSLPIPFAELDFGRTYFWRCTHMDTLGHPSVAGIETAFTFGAAPANQTNIVTRIAIDAATPWRYEQSGANLGTAWIQKAYDDSAWPAGPALLALETAALPEPIRTPLKLGPTTYYFRHHFNYSGPATTTLQLRTVLDDGAVIYINGRECWRLRMDGTPPSFGTLASQSVSDAVYEGPFDVLVTNLVDGDNVIAVEVHQSSTSSSDVVFGLSLQSRTVVSTGRDLVLNEVLADNRRAVTQAGTFPDYVELYNASDRTWDLTHHSLSDNELLPDKYVFPPGTRIAARGYLVVWCDTATNAPGLHTGFGLNSAGQNVVLFGPSADGKTVLDGLAFGPQATDYSIGRSSDGSSIWQLNRPTPGDPNQVQPTASLAGVRVNEWLASPESGDDWFELFNPQSLPVALGGHFLTSDLAKLGQSPIHPYSYIAAESFVRFVADGRPEQGATHVDFKLSAGGDSLALVTSNQGVVDSVTFGLQTTGVSQGRLPDGGAQIVSFPTTASPGDPNYLPLNDLVINEVLTHSETPFEDAIELSNLSTVAADLSGWFLSDDRRQPRKYRFPAGTGIPPGGFQVVYEYQFNPDPRLPASFALNSTEGDEVILSEVGAAGALTGYRATVRFGPSPNGVSWGRFATSTGVDFVALSQTSFGAEPSDTLDRFRNGSGSSNGYPRISPVVLSEIMYHPPDFIVGAATNDNTAHEYVELRNTTPSAIPLFDPAQPQNTWRVRGGIAVDFPPGIVLPPGGVLLLVNFAPTNAVALHSFRASYPGSVGALALGPYTGKLGNGGDRLELQQPDTSPGSPDAPAESVPFVTVDHVIYGDAPPWPALADGLGLALQRINDLRYANDPANWRASQPTPGIPGRSPPAPDADRDGLSDAWEMTFGFDPQDPGDASLDIDGDGSTNREEFAAGTDPRDPESRLRLGVTSRHTDDRHRLQLEFTGVSGHTYLVEYRDRLTGGAWVNLEAPIQVVDAVPHQVILPDGVGERYYRLRSL